MASAGSADKATLAFRCVDLVDSLDVEALEALVEGAREITYETFVKHVDIESTAAALGYATRRGQPGLRLQDDYAVHFFSGKWKGEPVHFLVHSAIEFVFRRQRADQALQLGDAWGGRLPGNTEVSPAPRRRPRP